MNKEFSRRGNTTYFVVNENGEQIAYTAKVGTSNKKVNEILTTENDIETLERDLWNLQCEKSDVYIKNQIAKGIYFILLPGLLALTSIVEANYGANLLAILGIGSVVTGVTTIYNISMNGTFLGRKHKINNLDEEIIDTKIELDKARNNIEKLKSETNFKEVSTTTVQRVAPIDRTYEEVEEKPLTKRLQKDKE